jgi:hypothetical protein
MGESQGTSEEWHERPEEKNDVGCGAQENCGRATRQVGQGKVGKENGVTEYAAGPQRGLKWRGPKKISWLG